MASNMQDIKAFYGLLRHNLYPKNGSWKDAPALRDYAGLVTLLLLSSDAFGFILALQHYAWSVVT